MELLVVIGLIAAVAITALVVLGNRRSASEVNAAGERIAALLREAQSRAVGQASSSAWGVHFDNTDPNTPFYALFAGMYSTSSRQSVYLLPTSAKFSTSTLAEGSIAEVTFAQITGGATGSSTIMLESRSDRNVSSTITITSAGSISR